jgi:hypothetical protein
MVFCWIWIWAFNFINSNLLVNYTINKINDEIRYIVRVSVSEISKTPSVASRKLMWETITKVVVSFLFIGDDM